MKYFIGFILLFSTEILSAQVRLPRLVSNSMVLQRDTKLKIWGWASAGEKIMLSLSNSDSKIYQASTNEKGEWKIVLPAQKAGGPFTMKVKGSNEIILSDILFGDVWVCSGQSNMEQPMGGRLKYKYADEIANANNQEIRQFLVPDIYSFNGPANDFPSGSWKAVNPKNIGEFTAVGYFFAKELYAKFKIPIGLINAALGGSPAEAWTSVMALPAAKRSNIYENKNLVNKIEAENRAITSAWYKILEAAEEGSKNNWKDPDFDDTKWKQINVPGSWMDQGESFAEGVIWFRKEIYVPSSMIAKPSKIELGRVIDADSVFINGKYAGNTTYLYPARRYELGSGILKEGKNVIAIRVTTVHGPGEFVPGKRYELTTTGDTINLTGSWKYKIGTTAKTPAPATTELKWKPHGLYNAMIAPLANYAIKGVIWYQGESNANDPTIYLWTMKTLINDWRHSWKQGNFPFLFVQLPNYMKSYIEPQITSNWAELRQHQLETLSVSNTGMAVAIDLGEWNDIHPENKKDVSYRLSLLARKLAYGEKNLVASGPIIKSIQVKGNKAILTFTNTGSGLMIKGNGPLKQFLIGGNKIFRWAITAIEGDKIIVWNDEIKNPVMVRYAWADNPEGANLYNKEGLPASPFHIALVKTFIR